MDKLAIRKQIRQQRCSLTKIQQKQASHNLQYNLLQIKRLIYAKKIAIYLPTNGEIDLMPFINWCFARKKIIYAPKISHYPKYHMRFIRIYSAKDLQIGKYKILEPKNSKIHAKINTLNVMLIPLLAFDLRGTRLGMGKGFYDRYLHKTHHKLKPLRIGIAHDFQQLPYIAPNSWDVPLHLTVTNRKIYQF